VKIIPYDTADQKIKDQIYKFVMDIKTQDLGWKADAPELLNIEGNYLVNKSNFWVVVNHNQLIGTVGLEDMGNRQGYLKRMYLKKEFRGTGLATELLNTMLRYAKQNRFKEIYLATGKGAERAVEFYKKSGFQKVDSLPSNFIHFDDPYLFKLELTKQKTS